MPFLTNGAAAKEDVIAWMQISLHTLGYFNDPPSGQSGPELTTGIRAFETARGSASDGILNMKEAAELQKEVDAFQPFEVYLPETYASRDFDKGITIVRGTWSLDGRRDELPTETIHIVCERHKNLCNGVTMTLSAPGALSIRMFSWKVMSWDEDGVIVAEDDIKCLRQRLTIPYHPHETRLETTFTGAEGCAELPTDNAIRTIKWGPDLAGTIRGKRLEERESHMAPALRQWSKRLRESGTNIPFLLRMMDLSVPGKEN
jgi:hypothetical protein